MTAFRNLHEVCLLLYIFTTFKVGSTAEDYVPVLIWESIPSKSQEISAPGLAKLSSTDFSRFLDDKLASYHDPLVILLFADEDLSVEDFAWRDTSGHASFPQLNALTNRSSTSITFLPSVLEPIRSLEEAGIRHGLTIRSLDTNPGPGQSLDLKARSVKHQDPGMGSVNNQDHRAPSSQNQDLNVGITLDVNAGKAEERVGGEMVVVRLGVSRPGESRAELLRRHDLEIARVIASRPAARVIGVYTAHAAAFRYADSVPRNRRQVSADPPPPTDGPGSSDAQSRAASSGAKMWYDKEGAMLVYFNAKAPLLEKINAKANEVISTSVSSDMEDQYTRLVVGATVGGVGAILRLCFSKTSAYWDFAKVEIEMTGETPVDLFPSGQDITVAVGRSYVCGGAIAFRGGNFRLVFTDVQIQAYMKKSAFSPAADCAPFFTMGIWTGVITVFILVVVMAWTLTMIMDIKTCDRLDDPNGKTIQVGPGT